ncbi:hypothetical protein tb265_33430 [Gemmatimonadetes bacterium T265]|nr:hypothetical protein tb265_33430 [Gemmatimonadetes bacterium T265]
MTDRFTARSSSTAPRAAPAAWHRRFSGAVTALGAVTSLGATRAPAFPARSARAAQDAVVHDSTRAAAPVPWGVGERLGYDVKFGILKAGSATLSVPEIVDVRGRPAYHAIFHVRGGTFFYHVDDTYESWIDTATLASLRFYQTQLEGGKSRNKRYEIFPERETYQDGDKPEERSVADPLDDGSLLYAVRTLPLRTGDVYELNRYYKPDRNPVRIRVVRREQIRVPAGTFNAIVVQPTVKTKGIFGEGGRAEVWFSDDEARVVLQVRSSLSFGSLTMQLRNRQDGHTGTP